MSKIKQSNATFRAISINVKNATRGQMQNGRKIEINCPNLFSLEVEIESLESVISPI